MNERLVEALKTLVTEYFCRFLFQCLEGHRCERVFEFYSIQLAKCLCDADDGSAHISFIRQLINF